MNTVYCDETGLVARISEITLELNLELFFVFEWKLC